MVISISPNLYGLYGKIIDSSPKANVSLLSTNFGDFWVHDYHLVDGYVVLNDGDRYIGVHSDFPGIRYNAKYSDEAYDGIKKVIDHKIKINKINDLVNTIDGIERKKIAYDLLDQVAFGDVLHAVKEDLVARRDGEDICLYEVK